jgi:glycosyltransferase involved in cell wall biosynthesis
MASGLPVIASAFPLWREVIEGSDCGICVDPTDPSAIARAYDALREIRPGGHVWGRTASERCRRGTTGRRSGAAGPRIRGLLAG